MAIVGVVNYSTTAGSNTDINSISTAEFCPIANWNNAVRQAMADISDKFQNSGTIAAAATTDLGTIPENYLTVTGTGGPITSFGTPTNKLDYYLRFTGAAQITTSANLIWAGLSSAVTVTLAVGDFLHVKYEGTSVWRILWCRTSTGLFYGGDAATSGYVLTAGGAGVAPTWAQQNILRTYLSGLTMSNAADTVNDITIAAGVATDSTNAVSLTLAATMTKQIDAAWAAGTNAGGLFTGSVAAHQIYHVFLIRKTSDGTIDAGFDTSVTAANIPSGYATFRRIGTVLTDGVPGIRNFTQNGNEITLNVTIVAFDTVNPGTAQVTQALSTATTLVTIPSGIAVKAKIRPFGRNNSTNYTAWVHPTTVTDAAPVASSTASMAAPMYTFELAGTNQYYWGPTMEIWTNTSAQIAYRCSASGAANRFGVMVDGWIDLRGQ